MKPWWQSKTVWINTLVALLLLAEQNTDALQGLVPDWLHKAMLFGLPIVNLLLRIATTKGLSFKPQMPQGGDAA